MTQRPLTVLVGGMVAADPFQGGATWAVLQYVLGLRRLGYEVHLIDPVEASALRPVGVSLAESQNAHYFRSITTEFGLQGSSALVLAGTRQTVGTDYAGLVAVGRRANVLINISGMLTDKALIRDIPVRVYLDLDPAFNQLWHSSQAIDRRFDGHTHFVTVGLAVGSEDCPVPDCGLPWITTVPPVVLERWTVARRVDYDGLTTVANFRAYGSVELDGVLYGQKVHSLRRFMELPRLTDEKLYLALSIHPDEERDVAALIENGWSLLDPADVAGTPASYQRFIRGSKAEFGIAKSGYVASACGWFSDRSVCYLASGRPVVAQDTGFSRYLPTGEGLLSFSTVDEALECIRVLREDFDGHALAARSIAEEHFDSDRVLTRLLDCVGVSP